MRLLILIVFISFSFNSTLVGQTNYSVMTIENLKKLKEDAVKQSDFAKAAEIKKEIDLREGDQKKIDELQAELDKKVKAEDFEGATAIQEQLKGLNEKKVKKENLKKQIADAVAKEDYESANKYKAELNALQNQDLSPPKPVQANVSSTKTTFSSNLSQYQVLYVSKGVRYNYWKEVYLYAGDKIRFEFDADKKKAEIQISDPPPMPKKTINNLGWETAPDITIVEYEFSKDGPHNFSIVVKSSGELKLIRIPASGKENLPTQNVPIVEPLATLPSGTRDKKGPVDYDKMVSSPPITQGGITIGKMIYGERQYGSDKEVCSIYNTQNVLVAKITILNAESLTEYMVTIQVDVLDASRHVTTSKSFSEMKGNTSEYPRIGLNWLVSNNYL